MKKRNKFSLSHHRILSCRMGQLVPIGLTEVLPGDTIQHATTGLIRCAPLVSPVMARADVRIHHLFVPMRLVFGNFENLITGGMDGKDNHVIPTIQSPTGGWAIGSLADYLGVPTGVECEVNALPFRAYNLVYNEYYRDEDLIEPVPFTDADSGDTYADYDVLNICWEKDYFTSARPWTQKGDAVTIPVDADPSGELSSTITADGPFSFIYQSTSPLVDRPFSTVTDLKVEDNGDNSYIKAMAYPSGSVSVSNQRVFYNGGLKVSTSSSGDSSIGSINVDDLRLALSLQRFKEARARFGSRYVEYLRYLGVISSDARLQRPEYLGGGRSPLQFSEVLQTAEGTDPVGTMRGHGITALRSNRYRRFFEEHGYVLSLMSVRPKTVYTNMLPRTFIRRTKEDFFQPELQHIGQQEVYNKELNASSDNPDGVFGYQDRYNEYRYHESSVSGEFRNTLNYWHMARDISGDFALNGDFVRCTPTDRIFAAPGTPEAPNDTLYCFFNHSIQARRIMSKMATPRIF